MIVRAKDKVGTIERAFQSVRKQTVTAEIVVVDSGSTDGTLDLAARFADRVIEIRPERFTYGLALNLGAQEATGQVHVALSAHCALPRVDWLERCLRHYDDSAVAAVNGRFPTPGDPDPSATFHQDYAHARANPWYGFSNHASCWRADVWRDQPFDERLQYAEDKEWALRVLRAGWVIALDPALVVDMSHQWQTTLRDRTSRQWRSACAIASFAPDARFGVAELAAEWWDGDVDHRPAWRRRLSPRRIADLAARYHGFRTGSRRRSPAPTGGEGGAGEIGLSLSPRGAAPHIGSVTDAAQCEPRDVRGTDHPQP